MKLVKLKSRKVKRMPFQIILPEWWVRVNELKKDDVIDVYIADTKELIIKKREV